MGDARAGNFWHCSTAASEAASVRERNSERNCQAARLQWLKTESDSWIQDIKRKGRAHIDVIGQHSHFLLFGLPSPTDAPRKALVEPSFCLRLLCIFLLSVRVNALERKEKKL